MCKFVCVCVCARARALGRGRKGGEGGNFFSQPQCEFIVVPGVLRFVVLVREYCDDSVLDKWTTFVH